MKKFGYLYLRSVNPGIISLFFLPTLVFPAFAQKNLIKGDKLYDRNMYGDAIPYYMKEIENGINETRNPASVKLANCYRLTGQLEEAEKWFKIIARKKRKDPENALNYGKALKSSAKYAEAAQQFEKYSELNPSDPMGKIYVESCHLAQKWLDEPADAEIRNIESLNTDGSEYSPFYFEDGIIFTSSREEGTKRLISFKGESNNILTDLFYVNLNKTLDELTTEKIHGLNTPFHEGPATYDKNNKVIYLTRTVEGKRNKEDKKNNLVVSTLQIYSSKMTDKGWVKPVSAFSFNSDKYSVGHPSLSEDGSMIFFMSDMPEGYGSTDIYVSYLKDSAWGKPVNLGPEINTFGHELFPYIHSNGTLYFASDIHPGMGKLDLFSAQLTDDKWTNVTNLKPPINSIGDDFGITIDNNGLKGLFSSNRIEAVGADDLFSFIRLSLLVITINGTTLQIKDQSLFDGTNFKLKDDETNENQSPVLENGNFSFEPEYQKSYTLSARKDGFSINKIHLLFSRESSSELLKVTLSPEKQPIKVNGILLKKQKILPDSLQTDSLFDETNPNPIEGATVFLKKEGAFIDTAITDQSGKYNFDVVLEQGNVYTIIATKSISREDGTMSYEENRKTEEANRKAQERLAKEAAAKIAEEERLTQEFAVKIAEEESIVREAVNKKKADEERLAQETAAKNKIEEERLAKETVAKKAEEKRLVREEKAKKTEEARLEQAAAKKKVEEEMLAKETAAKKVEKELLTTKEHSIPSTTSSDFKRPAIARFKGFVTNMGNNVPGAQVRLLDESKTISEAKTSENGEFTFEVKKNKSYSIIISRENYFDKFIDITTTPNSDNEEIIQSFELDKRETVPLDGQIKTGNTSPENTHISLSRKYTVVGNSKTDQQGKFSVDLLTNENYNITATKKGFFQQDIEVSTFGKKSSDVIDVEMELEELVIGKTIEIKNVYYDYDKAYIRYGSFIELDKLVLFLEINPDVKIELSSHADVRGSEEYNESLSQRRADVVADYLASKGIDKNRIITKAHGENRLAVTDAKSEDEHQLNRRTEFTVIEM